jgi:hypothetical protein
MSNPHQLKPLDRVQLTRYWLLHQASRGTPYIKRTEQDVGVFMHIRQKLYWPDKQPYAYVHWISGSGARDGYIPLSALEPYGTAR